MYAILLLTTTIITASSTIIVLLRMTVILILVLILATCEVVDAGTMLLTNCSIFCEELGPWLSFCAAYERSVLLIVE